MNTRVLVGVAVAVIAVGGIGVGVAVATEVDADAPLTGATLDQAVAAALQETGGGTVTETEVGDDGAAYGVEVRLDDGREVEVGLDRQFEVIGRETDDDREERDAD
jgi:uncharacterized membrane protein YkoI